MQPHPEGGWYKETWRESSPNAERASGTAIFYLLEAGQYSHWHKVDAAEIWHWYDGAPLTLEISPDDETPASQHVLGPDILSGQMPQIIVPKGHWQCAKSTGSYSLVGCTVSPGFEFSGFEMAPPHFCPGN